MAGQLIVFNSELARKQKAAEKPQPQVLSRNARECFQIAREFAAKKDFESAQNAYERVIELDPTFAAAYVNLGMIYFNHRNLSEAEKNFRKALEVNPGYALARFNLGLTLDDLNSFAEAVLEYERAIQLEPRYADAHYNAALVCDKTSRPERALRHWRSYVRIAEKREDQFFKHARKRVREIMEEFAKKGFREV